MTIIASVFAYGAWLVPCAFLVGLVGVSLGLFSKHGSEIGDHGYGKPHTIHGGSIDRDEMRAWTRGTR